MHKDYSIIAILLFPFLPFLSFLIACTDLRRRANGIVFILFYGLFGYCHTFDDIRADSYRKMLEFSYSSHIPLTDIVSAYTDGATMDIYQTWLFSQISIFTNNPNIMMMIVGLIGGFFSLLLIQRILKDYNKSFDLCVGLIILLVTLPISPVQMGGIRGFTALSIFSYSAIKFLIDKENKWLIPILCTPLIHFGYFVFVIATIIIRIIPIKYNVLFWPVIIVCIASLFLDTSSWAGITNRLNTHIENDAISYRTSHYVDSDTDANFNSSITNQILNIQYKIIACYVTVLLLHLRKNFNKLNLSQYTKQVYSILLFFLFIGFLFVTFSVVGQRYLYYGIIVLGMFLLNLYKENADTYIKYYIIIIPIIFIGNIAWTIYNSYCNTGIDIYVKTLPQLIL